MRKPSGQGNGLMTEYPEFAPSTRKDPQLVCHPASMVDITLGLEPSGGLPPSQYGGYYPWLGAKWVRVPDKALVYFVREKNSDFRL
ncbi:hypothetical protein TNCV_3579691 [Trichonephila clavipes]|nr:hypothetical protein TNCV_3579691 [Trichonephila clavipes]